MIVPSAMNPTRLVPRSSTGLRLPRRGSLQAERLPKLSLAGDSRSSCIHHGATCSRRKSIADADHRNIPSKPIPLPSTHIFRTTSELQLQEDMVVAEYRELCMFHRLVEGMKERVQEQIVTSGHDIHRKGSSRDSTSHFSSTKGFPTTTNNEAWESPKLADESSRSAFLVEALHRASEIADFPTEASTTRKQLRRRSSVADEGIFILDM